MIAQARCQVSICVAPSTLTPLAQLARIHCPDLPSLVASPPECKLRSQRRLSSNARRETQLTKAFFVRGGMLLVPKSCGSADHRAFA